MTGSNKVHNISLILPELKSSPMQILVLTGNSVFGSTAQEDLSGERSPVSGADSVGSTIGIPSGEYQLECINGRHTPQWEKLAPFSIDAVEYYRTDGEFVEYSGGQIEYEPREPHGNVVTVTRPNQ